MSDDETTLTTALEVVWSDVISKGRQIAELHKDQLSAIQAENLAFQSGLDSRITTLNRQIHELTDEHERLSNLAARRLEALLEESRLTAEETLRKSIESYTTSLAGQTSAEVIRLTDGGLTEVIASLGAKLAKIAQEQESASKEFSALAKSQAEAADRVIRRMEVGAQTLDYSLTEASKRVTWSWTKRLLLFGASALIFVVLGLAGGNWILLRYPPAYPKEVQKRINNGVFLEQAWPKLNKAEQNRLIELSRMEGNGRL